MKTVLCVLVLFTAGCVTKNWCDQAVKQEKSVVLSRLGHLRPVKHYIPWIVPRDEEVRLGKTLVWLRLDHAKERPMCASFERFCHARTLHERVLANPAQLTINLDTSLRETKKLMQVSYYQYALAFVRFLKLTPLMQRHKGWHCLPPKVKMHPAARAHFEIFFGERDGENYSSDWLQFTITRELITLRKERYEGTYIVGPFYEQLSEVLRAEMIRFGTLTVAYWRKKKEEGDDATIREYLQMDDIRPIDLGLTDEEAGRIMNSDSSIEDPEPDKKP